MPDTGDFDQRDPDTDHAAHADWAGAFAALPLESPSADGWHRVQARLPAAAPARRTRWPLWLATAASLALVVAIPLRMQSDMTPETSATIAPAIPAAAQRDVDAAVEALPLPVTQLAIEKTRLLASASPAASATIARTRTPRRDRHVDPAKRPIRTVAQPADTTRIANHERVTPPAPLVSLESFYAQSARLENVLALARDDRVSSGTAAALTDTLDAQVATIDAALIQPGVSTQGRMDLWNQRIATLRQLVGIETTQRLYAARGQQYQAALVSID